MSTQEKDVIKTVKVQTAKRQKPPVTSRAYRGTSTVPDLIYMILL